MQQNNKKTASNAIMIAAGLTLATSVILPTQVHAGGKEKCYGVVKAGYNDCATNTASCVGSATRDAQTDAFVVMPKGLCKKLVGGSLKSS